MLSVGQVHLDKQLSLKLDSAATGRLPAELAIQDGQRGRENRRPQQWGQALRLSLYALRPQACVVLPAGGLTQASSCFQPDSGLSALSTT